VTLKDLLQVAAEDVTTAPSTEERSDTKPRDMEEGLVPCTYHPKVQTALRCNRCGKPICPRCAVLTEVGYRCPDCIRGQESVFFNLRWSDYPVVVVVTGVVAGLAAMILSQAGLFIALFLSPVVGGLIARLAPRAMGWRRGRYVWLAVGSAVFVGSSLGLLLSWLLFGPVNLLASLAYLVLATTTVVGGLK
jgi:hypothetical protein